MNMIKLFGKPVNKYWDVIKKDAVNVMFRWGWIRHLRTRRIWTSVPTSSSAILIQRYGLSNVVTEFVSKLRSGWWEAAVWHILCIWRHPDYPKNPTRSRNWQFQGFCLHQLCQLWGLWRRYWSNEWTVPVQQVESDYYRYGHKDLICFRAIAISYAFKKDSKGERHGSAAERLLAAQNPLSQVKTPYYLSRISLSIIVWTFF